MSGSMDHRLHDQRSLAMHMLIAEKIKNDPSLLEVAKATIARWRPNMATHSLPYLDAWQQILEQGVEATVAAAVDPSERGTQLRQGAPFASILTQAERQEFLRAWHAEHGNKAR